MIKQIITNWIIGQFYSRALIGLAIIWYMTSWSVINAVFWLPELLLGYMLQPTSSVKRGLFGGKKGLKSTVKGHNYSSLPKNMREIFTPVVHTVNRKTWCRARVWSIKAGKISKNRNKQTSDQEHEINCTVPERKEIRAVCILTPRLFSHSTLSSTLGR